MEIDLSDGQGVWITVISKEMKVLNADGTILTFD